MTKYRVFVNGSQQGSIRTSDIDSALKEMYGDAPITYKVNKRKKAVSIQTNLLDVMNHALKFEQELNEKRVSNGS